MRKLNLPKLMVDFEWTVHELEARRKDLEEEIIEIVSVSVADRGAVRQAVGHHPTRPTPSLLTAIELQKKDRIQSSF